MTREEYIKICNTCKNRGFDSSQGVICSLSSALPAFEEKCEDYLQREEGLSQKAMPELDPKAIREAEDANNDILWGTVWAIGGMIATVADIGFIFWGAIGYGCFLLIRGLANGGSWPSSKS